jgi:NAD(P)-dependent dehydrogenase (short-subunit alcohol dehydrogenase family)
LKGFAHVAFVARTARAVERTASETAACGIVGDIGRKEDIYPIALQVTGNLGGLDALINNASSLGPTPLAPVCTENLVGIELMTESRHACGDDRADSAVPEPVRRTLQVQEPT